MEDPFRNGEGVKLLGVLAGGVTSTTTAGSSCRRRRSLVRSLSSFQENDMEDPFRSGDAVTLLGVLAGGVIAIVAIIGIGAWTVASYLSQPEPPENHTPVVTVCSGCGSEWHSRDPGPHKPIEKCPNCPMSDEEFEALKRKYGKPANHLPPSASVLVEEPSR